MISTRLLRTLLGAMAVAMLVSVSACGGDDADSNVSDQTIDDQEDIWERQDIDDYTFTYEERKSGPDLRVTVKVRDDNVRDVDYDSSSDAPSTPGATPLTIKGLFDLVRRAKEEAQELNVQFDPTYGYPSFIAVDWMPGGLNDETDIEVTRFTPE